MFALTNPFSTGRDLTASFREYGAVPLHLWETDFQEEYVRDAHPHKLLIDASEANSIQNLPISDFVPGSELGVELADTLSATFQRPANVFELSHARTSKLAMQERLAEVGVPAIPTQRVRTVDESRAAAAALRKYPVIVKPARGAGSEHVAICSDQDAVVAACAEIFGTKNVLGVISDAVIQEYQFGSQYIVNSVSLHGTHVLSDVHRYSIDELGGVPWLDSTMLIPELTPELEAIVRYCFDCLDVLGVREGAAHCEIRATPDGPRLIEINARIMGGSQDPVPYRRALGRSHADLTAERYVSPEVFLKRKDAPYRANAALAMAFPRSSKTGIVKAVHRDAFATLPSFYSLRDLPRIGDTLFAGNPAGGTANNGAVVLLSHEDQAAVEQDLRFIGAEGDKALIELEA